MTAEEQKILDEKAIKFLTGLMLLLREIDDSEVSTNIVVIATLSAVAPAVFEDLNLSKEGRIDSYNYVFKKVVTGEYGDEVNKREKAKL